MKQNKEEKINKERERDIERNKNKKEERERREREREREKGKLSRKTGRHWTLVSNQRQSKQNTNKTQSKPTKTGRV